MTNNQFTTLQIDWNGIVNAISTMMVMAFIVGMVGLMGKQLLPERHSPGEQPYLTMPAGTCYEDAWHFLSREQEGYLIHGYIESDDRRIAHAWVETETGYIWEPESGQFFPKSGFKGKEEARYSWEQAAIMAVRTKNYGPWTEAERKVFLKSQHHFLGDKSGLTERIRAGTDVR